MVSPNKTQRLIDWLTDALNSGRIPSGSLLPSEHELMAYHQLSRVTVRKALNALKKNGAIESIPRRGWRAKSRQPEDIWPKKCMLLGPANPTIS